MIRVTLILLALVITLSAAEWTKPLLESRAVMAFVLSDAFWPTAFAVAIGLGVTFAAASAAFFYHPSRSGRTELGGRSK